MFSDEEIKENSLMRPGDEIIRSDLRLFFTKVTQGFLSFVTFYYVFPMFYWSFLYFSIREVCLVDKYDKKYLGGETLLSTSGRNDVCTTYN